MTDARPNIIFIITDEQRYDTIRAWAMSTWIRRTWTGWCGGRIVLRMPCDRRFVCARSRESL